MSGSAHFGTYLLVQSQSFLFSGVQCGWVSRLNCKLNSMIAIDWWVLPGPQDRVFGCSRRNAVPAPVGLDRAGGGGGALSLGRPLRNEATNEY